MKSPQVANFGSWHSPFSAAMVAFGANSLGQVITDGDDLYWVEMRPSEGGRNVVVRQQADETVADITPSPFNVRTRVHEYGGGAFTVVDGQVYFANFADQRLYRQHAGNAPQPLTAASARRYADFAYDAARERLICVREDHSDSSREAVNTIACVSLGEGVERILVAGSDFYSSPRLSPDHRRLAWLSWHHPNMPWDGCELWVAEFDDNGNIGSPEHIAGGLSEAIVQPEWSPDGVLHFVSDRSGFWNLYRRLDENVESLCPMQADFAAAHWVFGLSTYAFLASQRLICAYTTRGSWRLATIDTPNQELTDIRLPYSEISFLRAHRGAAVFIAASPTEASSVVRLPIDRAGKIGEIEILQRSNSFTPDADLISAPQAIEFATRHGRKQLTAHGFFYAPKNSRFRAPEGTRPPLIVISHGGPTAATSTALNLKTQYWTSRGIAVLDVNYSGSTGYGRAYRERLKGGWGVIDVDDCVAGAHYLVERGEADRDKLIIRGASAGGYTTLCALTFRDVFKAGASYYGVSDLEALDLDTHKFESRYTASLVGPYPEMRATYVERSPVHFASQLSCPIILLQGLEDKIVPPNQAEKMLDAVRAKGLPVAYIAFEGEQHGFRRAENVKRALEAELYFYAQIFGFALAETIEPIAIENLPLRNPA
ncbi:MAG: S9 family peptidase [Burkholderiales bacterium]|nr:S9 family peptidase [Burkholderiales bacterium]